MSALLYPEAPEAPEAHGMWQKKVFFFLNKAEPQKVVCTSPRLRYESEFGADESERRDFKLVRFHYWVEALK